MATVLIVEDDEHVRVLAESIIQAHGFQTVAAEGSEQALAFFNDPDQQIDLLFTSALCLRGAGRQAVIRGHPGSKAAG